MKKIETQSLLNLEETIAKNIFDGITYPFEALPKIKEFIANTINNLDDEYNIIDGKIAIHKDAIVSPKSEIVGPVIICANALIKPFAYIRENVIIGEYAQIGNSCELKNSIVFNYAQVPHYNYVGDSIIGYKSHFGAGAITSNLKSDKTNIILKIEGETFETGLRKFGAIVGDNVEIGCNTVLNPGTIIGRNSNIYPVSCVRGFIDSNMIYKDRENIIEKQIKE